MGVFDFLKRSKPAAKSTGKARPATRKYNAPLDRNSPGGWLPGGGSTERAPAALPYIRRRSRDLAHNNPHAARAVSILTSHAVGRGIRFGIKGDAEYSKAFSRWAGSTDVDFEGRLNLYGLQSVAARTMFEAGDAFLVMRDSRFEGGLRPTLQLIDPDQIDEMASPKSAKNTTVAGVEVDKSGRIVGYHIRPDLASRSSEFVKAANVIHLMEILYPGQVRGIPRGSQALNRSNAVDVLFTAALARARVEACITAFVKRVGGDENGGTLGEEEQDDDHEMLEMLEPGTISYLRDGEEVTMVQPSTAGGLREYITLGHMSVAMAYRCTYEQISGDLSGSNYNSAKAGRLEFNRDMDTTREHAIHPGMLRIEQRFRSCYQASESRDVEVEVTLTPPGRESIEPAKEALADMVELASGGMTLGQYMRSKGLDLEEQLNELARERSMVRDRGLTLKYGAQEISALTEDPDAQIDPETGEPIDNSSADLRSMLAAPTRRTVPGPVLKPGLKRGQR